jgi:hypothetical protein
MKAPRHSPTKIRIAQGGPSPHRRQRLIETDVSYCPFRTNLSYKLLFSENTHPSANVPYKTSLESRTWLNRRTLSTTGRCKFHVFTSVLAHCHRQSVPIHRQSFPISTRSNQDHEWEVMDSDEEGESGTLPHALPELITCTAHLGASSPQGFTASDPHPRVHFNPSASQDSVPQAPGATPSETPSKTSSFITTTTTNFSNPSPTDVSTLKTSPKLTSTAKSGSLPTAKPALTSQGFGAIDTMAVQSAATAPLSSPGNASPAPPPTGNTPFGSHGSIEGALNAAQISRAAVSRACTSRRPQLT